MSETDLLELAVALFGVAWVAFGLWLAVRLFNRRERWARNTAWGMGTITAFYVMLFLLVLGDELVFRILYPMVRIFFGD